MKRRGMLSSLSSVYDSLGLAAPSILDGRRIIQSLCHQNFDWDEQIPDNMSRKYFKPKKFGKIREYSFHNFSDVSEYGFSQCSYL